MTTVFHGGYNAATIAKNSPGIFGMVGQLFPPRGGMSVTGMEVDIINEDEEYIECTTTATTPTKYKIPSDTLNSPPQSMKMKSENARVLMEEVSQYSGRACTILAMVPLR
jgi:hypothetical protein